MKKALRLIIVILMMLGIALSILNFVSVDNMAGCGGMEGTLQSDGTCVGEILNC